MKSTTLRKHHSHPNGWNMNLCMTFEGLAIAGWSARTLHKLEHPAGYSITAEFGSVDGFPCWKYRTCTPDGKTLGTYPSAAAAALWIDRDIRANTRVG